MRKLRSSLMTTDPRAVSTPSSLSSGNTSEMPNDGGLGAYQAEGLMPFSKDSEMPAREFTPTVTLRPGYDAEGNQIMQAPQKKGRPDWRLLLKRSLQGGLEEAMNSQEDPMDILARHRQMAEQHQGRIY